MRNAVAGAPAKGYETFSGIQPCPAKASDDACSGEAGSGHARCLQGTVYCILLALGSSAAHMS
jgi:hypothetical protein